MAPWFAAPVVVEKVIAVVEPGTSAVAVPAASEAQLLAVPLETARAVLAELLPDAARELVTRITTA